MKSPFARSVRSRSTASAPGWEAFSRLRKILGYFRAHGRSELARYAELVDNIAVGKSAAGKAVLKVLVVEGLLEWTGDLYVLSRQRMSELGINRTDLVESRMTPGISALLAKLPVQR